MPTSIQGILEKFSDRTSSHAIPIIGKTKRKTNKSFWAVLFTTCMVISAVNGYYLLEKFLKFDKVTMLEIKFEPAPFPAVTICNLNPYKMSELKNIEEVKQSLSLYNFFRHRGKQSSKQKSKGRHKRGRITAYVPVRAYCTCGGSTTDECAPLMERMDEDTETCYCWQAIKDGSLWPCFHKSAWTFRECDHCLPSGRCTMTLGPYNPNVNHTKCLCNFMTKSCVRQPHDEIPMVSKDQNYFVLEKNAKILPDLFHFDFDPQSKRQKPPSQALLKKHGIENMDDSMAIASKTKQNIESHLANMNETVRVNVSYSREDMIHMCSFDSSQCDMEGDFRRHVDPAYGNCYTFNWDINGNKSSSRPGPMYGLRALIDVGIDEYMTTTQSAGIRLAVHENTEPPFPDIFGYSAPTGIVSSFALKLKRIKRLPRPYGDCQRRKPENYIYQNHQYTIEGCHRSCFQRAILEECECGYSRFPVPDGKPVCSFQNEKEERCLRSFMENQGGPDSCHCRQPCSQSAYVVTYSAGTLPQKFFAGTECEASNTSCLLKHTQTSLMLEVYYEQSIYEYIEEREAYGWVTLVADFGGQMGLWMGFSIITVIEWFVLYLGLVSYCCCKRKGHTQNCSLIEENQNVNESKTAESLMTEYV